jgi:hypothetical protein
LTHMCMEKPSFMGAPVARMERQRNPGPPLAASLSKNIYSRTIDASYPFVLMFPPSRPPRGVFPEDTPKMGRDAAPARGLVIRTREALGPRPPPLRGAAFNGWTWMGRRRAKACRMKVARRPPSQPGSTGPRTEIAASGAPGGASLRSQGERGRLASVPGGRADRPGGLANLRVCRRSAPLAFKGARNCISRRTRRRSNNTGDFACVDHATYSAHSREGGNPAPSLHSERVQFCKSALGPRLERRRIFLLSILPRRVESGPREPHSPE